MNVDKDLELFKDMVLCAHIHTYLGLHEKLCTCGSFKKKTNNKQLIIKKYRTQKRIARYFAFFIQKDQFAYLFVLLIQGICTLKGPFNGIYQYNYLLDLLDQKVLSGYGFQNKETGKKEKEHTFECVP